MLALISLAEEIVRRDLSSRHRENFTFGFQMIIWPSCLAEVAVFLHEIAQWNVPG